MKKFVVEPRNEDGSLNAKLVGCEPFKNKYDGMTEDELFDIYFAANKQKEWATWDEMVRWFEELGGYKIREKNW